MYHAYDVVVIGTGLAGLCVAIELADDYKVALLSKDKLGYGATPYAQGGIAVSLSHADEIDLHVKDTMVASDFLGKESVVKHTVAHSEAAIRWLVAQGVEFTHDLDEADNTHWPFALTREGGHSIRRIVHVDDTTGLSISSVLIDQVEKHHNIDVFEQMMVVDLITDNRACTGVMAVNQARRGEVLMTHQFDGKTVVLATGGASGLYEHTTSACRSCGDGMAMAHRVGCQLNNMEFVQFHPTTFYNPGQVPFLISEAVRGEGGRLLLPNGERFMERYDPRLELAPRDVIARAIDAEMKRHEVNHVYLDITHRERLWLKQRFPSIDRHCLKHKIDIASDLIPVVPGAHYTCGGIVVDLNSQTHIDRLYAVGEVACTGLHGANRLASNSLLECVVFARCAAASIKAQFDPSYSNTLLQHKQVDGYRFDQGLCLEWTAQLRRVMTQHVGIVRTNRGLKYAFNQLIEIERALLGMTGDFRLSIESINLHNQLEVTKQIVTQAIDRYKNKGGHFNLDCCETQEIYCLTDVK